MKDARQKKAFSQWRSDFSCFVQFVTIFKNSKRSSDTANYVSNVQLQGENTGCRIYSELTVCSGEGGVTTSPLVVLDGWICSRLLCLFYHCTSSPPYSACLSKAIMNACSTTPHDSPRSRLCQRVIFVPVTWSSAAFVITSNNTNVLFACRVPPKPDIVVFSVCLQTSAVRMRGHVLAYSENLPSRGGSKYYICSL